MKPSKSFDIFSDSLCLPTSCSYLLLLIATTQKTKLHTRVKKSDYTVLLNGNDVRDGSSNQKTQLTQIFPSECVGSCLAAAVL